MTEVVTDYQERWNVEFDDEMKQSHLEYQSKNHKQMSELEAKKLFRELYESFNSYFCIPI